ncbi:ATP-grasp domain-containing protein [Photobacterium sp. DNB22_13_2]
MNNKIYILTQNEVFSQHLKPWSTLDITSLRHHMAAHGIEVATIEYSEAINSKDINGNIFISSSSQNLKRKQYIEDICFDIQSRGGTLIPNFDMIKCHENKGYQALLSARLGVKKPAEEYIVLGDASPSSFSYPCVIKTIDGAGSNGVALAKDENDLKRFHLKNIMKFSGTSLIIKYLKQVIKKNLKHKTYSEEQNAYYKTVLPACKQELIPNLSHDFKVLVFGDKYFCLKRNIRKNDFRASGSNLFELVDEIDSKVLDFCRDTFNKLDVPYLSIDVAVNNNDCYVIEFQAPHFGPYTALSANKYFTFDKVQSKWNKNINGDIELEELYAESLCRFVQLGCK